jgi:3-dehydroquinate synthetase
MAKIVSVGKGASRYDVIIARNAMNKKNLLSHLNNKNKVLIITDSGIPKKYIKELKIILNKKKVYLHVINEGEKSKSFSTYKDILEKLADLKFDRSDCMIAFGGGVVGDITGFCAASYLRGIDFIQIPTTLLAQVDSSVGGKTAINIKQGKNLVGAFYNPTLVLISTKYLETLSEKEYKSGLGEVTKYALIGNKKLYKFMQINAEKIKLKKLNALENIIEESVKSKAKIVTSDEKEKGIRAILNFGHTLGMVIAAKISFFEGHIQENQLDDMINLIQSLGLKIDYSKYSYDDLKDYILNDKKVSKGKLNLILINNKGKAFKTNQYKINNLRKAFT